MWDFVIRGSRGTIQACGAQHLKYGGHTTCFSVATDRGLLIIDAGTGITDVAADIRKRPELPLITLLFTHFHMDHVVGLPVFDPVYNSKAQITIHADPRRKDNWKETLGNFMAKPYWPVGLGDCAADMSLQDLPIDTGSLDRHGIHITWFRVPHPQQCLAYRLDMPGFSVVVATDMEHDTNGVQAAFATFCRAADYLICDAHYTPAEYPSHCGWGHSTWEAAAMIAAKSEVCGLILTHHAPTRPDAEIDAIVDQARKVFPNTAAARDGMVLNRDTKLV